MHKVVINITHSEKLCNDMQNWCDKNLTGMNFLYMYSRRSICFAFDCVEDAMAFKLRWIQNERISS